jgi:CubicO group peptidase (beta-lactamase class C family)
MDKLARMPLMAQPGEKWVYSDMNCNTALAIVDKVTGMRADEYMQEALFDPLNMQESWFYLPESVHDRVATTYYGSGGNEGQKGDVYTCDSVAGCEEGGSEVDFSFKTDGEFVYGGGSLQASTYDFFRFAQMLLNGGELDGVRVLSASFSVALRCVSRVRPFLPASKKALDHL